MFESPGFNIGEWSVPPVLLPIFIVLLVAVSAIMHWQAIFN
jgi:hypothetical protein